LNAPLPTQLHYPHPDVPEPGRVIEVADGVFWLRMPLPFALDHINLWLLRDRIDGVDGWTLVDTGYGSAATRSLWDEHFAATFDVLPLLRVIVTHFHPDHVGNAGWLLDRVQGPKLVWMTQGEFAMAHLAWGGAINRMDDFGRFFIRHGMPADIANAQAARGNIYRDAAPQLPHQYRRLVSGDNVRIGGRDWRVIVGLGHAPEHMSLFCPAINTLIAGDMLLPKISTNVSVTPAEPDGDPLSLFLSSINVFTRLPEETLVLPSHGLPFIGIKPRVAALAEHHRARLAELDDAAGAAGEAAGQAPAAGVTAHDLLPVLFRRKLDIQQQFFAMGESIAHLNHLWHRNRLERHVGDDDVIRFKRSRE
jgi:glyoxylase-like metal-dependent hydrolase (beta-lactamase superfamily II)